MTVKYIPLHDSHVPRMGSDLKVEEPFNHHKLRGIPESPTHSITTSTEQCNITLNAVLDKFN